MADLLTVLRDLVTELESSRKIILQIDRQRTITESPQTTLTRLLEERAAIVKLLTRLKAPHNTFDYEFKESFVRAVTSIVDPDRLKLALLQEDDPK